VPTVVSARSHLLKVALSFLLAGGAVADVVPWLYEVEVPVENQSREARLDASGEALLQVLTRVTGLTSVPRVEAVREALSAPDRYYNQFRYLEVEGVDADGRPIEELKLIVQFERGSLLQLVKDAELPVWRSNRPRVVAWVVLDRGGVRSILSPEDAAGLASGLSARARDRGVLVSLPLMDLQDSMLVDPAAVWGRVSTVLEPASARYGADVVLVGRLQRIGAEQWASAWDFWLDGDLHPFSMSAENPSRLVEAGVDFLADELAQRHAVLGRLARPVLVGVSGVGSARDYGELLSYLAELEFVDDIAVAGVKGDRLGLVVTTRADVEQLLANFRFDRRLEELPGAVPGSADVELLWRR
jgi:hypothetical protein